jgi:hypothetical protein
MKDGITVADRESYDSAGGYETCKNASAEIFDAGQGTGTLARSMLKMSCSIAHWAR